jgi:hypothetical protein
MRRWLLRIGIGALVLVVVLVVAAKLILRTGFAADKVAAQLQSAAGGAPVHVGSLDVGLTGSSLHDLQFLEDGAAPGSTPWATVPDVDADVSLVHLIRGDLTGGAVTLHNPKLTFRLDRENRMLTKLPDFGGGASQALPDFKIVGASIVFRREGHPDAVFSNISGTFHKDGDRMTLDGAADDPDWGQWTILGERSGGQAPFKLALHTDRLRATPDKLRRVPYVPPVTWQQVTLDGETPVDLAIEFGGSGAGPAVRYRVALAPKATTVQVPSIGLVTQNTAGQALVEDGVVTLTDVHGSAAGGTIRVVKSVMDFRGEGSNLRFNVNADKLVLKDLPKRWGLPQWDGRLTGKADLTVTTDRGQVRTSGGGSGVIEGFLSQKIDVKLTANEGGYKFDVTNEPGARLVPKAMTESDSHTTAALAQEARAVLAKLLATGLLTVEADPPAPQHNAAQTIRINLGLKDISLSELVQKLDVKLPIHVDGKLTFHVQASIPLSDAKDVKAYHATGTVELPWARIEDLWLQQVKARLIFENGVLRLDELSARQPNTPPTGPPTQLLPGGTVLGTASLGVSPAGDLTANLKVTALPIGQLLRAMPNPDLNAAGTADGQVQFRAPAGALRDIQKWTASGNLVAHGLQAFGRSAEEIAINARLDGGVVHVTDAHLKLQGSTIAGSGQLTLSGEYPYQAHVNLPPSDLAAWQQVVPELRAVRLVGQARITADAPGTLRPFAIRADGTAHVDDLAVQSFRVGTLDFRWDADPNRLHLADFDAALYGGRLTGTADIPIRPDVGG